LPINEPGVADPPLPIIDPVGPDPNMPPPGSPPSPVMN
jgi:hypothetical protein